MSDKILKCIIWVLGGRWGYLIWVDGDIILVVGDIIWVVRDGWRFSLADSGWLEI